MTRVPELKLSELVKAGLTTIVGLLGTDGTSRSIENLTAKAKAINELGITCYCLTGSYGYPSITITGDIKKDIAFIKEIIGTKIAISDHRSPTVSFDELARLASDTKIGGMISGKAGIVTVHVGNGKAGLDPLFKIIEDTDIPISVFRPTHLSRNPLLIKHSYEFDKLGGYIDYTCNSMDVSSIANTIKDALDAGVPKEKITFSSDGYGSWSNYDSDSNLIEIGVSTLKSMYDSMIEMVTKHNFTLSNALELATSNVAKALKINDSKGHLLEGYDADILLIDKDFNIDTYIACGKIMMYEKEITVKFPFE